MDIEVVHHQMDGFGVRVLERQFSRYLGELHCRAIRGSEGEMAASFRLHRTENIRRSAALVLVIPARFASRLGRGCGLHWFVKFREGFVGWRRGSGGDLPRRDSGRPVLDLRRHRRRARPDSAGDTRHRCGLVTLLDGH